MTILRQLAKIVSIFLLITSSTAIGNQLNAQDGKALFSANCASCHAVNKKLTGPALAGVEDRWPEKKNLYAWIKNSAAFLKTGDPYATKLYEEYNKTAMNNFPGLADADIDAILAYIKTVPAAGAAPAAARRCAGPGPRRPRWAGRADPRCRNCGRWGGRRAGRVITELPPP